MKTTCDQQSSFHGNYFAFVCFVEVNIAYTCMKDGLVLKLMADYLSSCMWEKNCGNSTIPVGMEPNISILLSNNFVHFV